MTCRVRENTPTALPVTAVEQRGTQPEDVFLGLVEVLDPQVEVELLGSNGIRPLRWPVVFHALEGQHEPRVGVKRRPTVVE